MDNFLSSTTNDLILKRHIERKLNQFTKENNPIKKQTLIFEKSLGEKIKKENFDCLIKKDKFAKFIGSFNNHLLNQKDKLSRQCFPLPSNTEESLIAAPDILLPLDTSLFSVFHEPSSINIKESENHFEDVLEKDYDKNFREWFLRLFEKIDKNVEFCIMDDEDVFVEVVKDNLVIRSIHNSFTINSQLSWTLVRLICQSPLIKVFTLSSKPIIKAVIQSCQTTINMTTADLARLLSFLCDHPFFDMQLAHSLLNPGEKIMFIKDLIVYKTDMDDKEKNEINVLLLGKNVLRKLWSLNLFQVYENIVCPTNVILAALEHRGIDIDIELWKEMKINLEESLRSLECQAHNMDPSVTCLSSALHMKEVIYYKLKLQEYINEGTRKQLGIDQLIENRSTNELVLSKLAQFHPLPGIIIKYRQISKTKSIYIDSFSTMMEQNSSSIKGEWDQASSVTGRIFCSRPNLQALPRDSEDGSFIDIKSIFVAPKNYLYISADFCQIELRLFAHVAQDRQLVEIFQQADRNHKDVFEHLSEFLDIHNCGFLNRRTITKKVIYGCIYGVGARSLSETLSISFNQASDLLRRVHSVLPSIKAFSSLCIETVVSKGYLETITSRKRSFEINKDYNDSRLVEICRQMVNFVIQGSAADICKLAMIECQRNFGYNYIEAQLILSRHDELLWLVHKDCLSAMLEIVYKQMNIVEIPRKANNNLTNVPLLLPMVVKVKKGEALGDMKHSNELI